MATFTLPGKLLMIPIPINENGLNTIPDSVQQKTISLKYLFVENIRTARRYLKSIDKSVNIDTIQFEEINKNNAPNTDKLKLWLQAGYEVGVMSEAGCPGVADPGSILVAKAQEWGAEVVPFVGPSAILLALMASGFNGQRFRFLGYLPVKNPERNKVIKDIENTSKQFAETQIFIETPYRNHQLINDLLQQCSGKTKLCIAADITSEKSFIKTLPLSVWKNYNLDIHKVPAIFLLMAE